MHISIQNLGPVKEGEFDLKPLTVFIGDNRQGKTQTLYTATAFLDYISYALYAENYIGKEPLSLKEIEQLTDSIIKNNNASIDIVSYFKNNGEEYFGKLLSLVPILGPLLLGARRRTLADTHMRFELNDMDREHAETFIMNAAMNVDSVGLGIKIIKEKGNPNIFIYKTENFTETVPRTEILKTLLHNILKLIHHSLYPGFVYFPAERTSIVPLWQIIQNQKKKTETLNLGKALAGTPYPLYQYMAFLTYLRTNSDRVGLEQLTLSDDEDRKKYRKLADILSTEITGDNIKLVPSQIGLERDIVVECNGTEIELPLASSGVKGLLGLVLYLRYYAKKGDYIVIDEPEENLHPTQQVKFIEFLAILVNNGINVAITTHSPYIVEHLESLIKGYTIDEIRGTRTGKKELAERLQLKCDEAFIAKDKVGCYIFEEGTITDILEEDGEINWQTFCETANIVNNTALFIQGTLDQAEDEMKESADMCAVAEEKREYQK